MFRWLSLASLVAIIVLTVGETETRMLYGSCKNVTAIKTFSQRLNNNDSCTFTVPFVHCIGFCETEAKPNPKNVKHNAGAYELVLESRCECCQPDPSTTKRYTLPPGSFKCQENPELTWDREIKLDIAEGCYCLPCRPSHRLPPD